MNADFSTLPKAMFITGTDTDAGKSYATGLLAKSIAESGRTVITQKFVQTGNHEFSEDIDVHRKLMGTPLLRRDLDHTTAPIILSYPASPDLAARIDKRDIDFEEAARSTEILSKEFDHVLVEGAGGIMVPLKGEYLTIDYVREHALPTLVVVNGKLGSINHSLLTVKALASYEIPVWGIIYNSHFDTDPIICTDTKAYLQAYMQRHHPYAQWIEI